MKKILMLAAAAGFALPVGAAPLRAPNRTKAHVVVKQVKVFPAGTPVASFRQSRTVTRSHSGAATTCTGGLGIEMAVVGRLTGNAGVLYRTSLDVTNFTSTSSIVDFYIDGTDLTTNQVITTSGVFTNDNAQTVMLGTSSIHFDDLINDLVNAGFLSPSVESDGFLGSMLIVFENFCGSGQGAATARFYSDFSSGGTIGVAVNGHELTGTEPQSIVGVFRDTRGESGVPQLYPNMFLNNMGYIASDGTVQGDNVTVQLTAYSNTTGQIVGTQKSISIAAFQTASVSGVLDYLNVPTSDDTVIVFADVTSGLSSVIGVGAQIDNTTKDPSGFDMSPVY